MVKLENKLIEEFLSDAIRHYEKNISHEMRFGLNFEDENFNEDLNYIIRIKLEIKKVFGLDLA